MECFVNLSGEQKIHPVESPSLTRLSHCTHARQHGNCFDLGVNESGRETGQSSRKGCAVRISQNASARIRRIALMVCGGVVAGVLTAGTVGAGTASAAEKHNDAGPAGPGKGFSPN